MPGSKRALRAVHEGHWPRDLHELPLPAFPGVPLRVPGAAFGAPRLPGPVLVEDHKVVRLAGKATIEARGAASHFFFPTSGALHTNIQWKKKQ